MYSANDQDFSQYTVVLVVFQNVPCSKKLLAEYHDISQPLLYEIPDGLEVSRCISIPGFEKCQQQRKNTPKKHPHVKFIMLMVIFNT